MSHRPSLFKYHQFLLRLDGNNGWSFEELNQEKEVRTPLSFSRLESAHLTTLGRDPCARRPGTADEHHGRDCIADRQARGSAPSPSTSGRSQPSTQAVKFQDTNRDTVSGSGRWKSEEEG